MIVDDESYFREYLKKTIPWHKYGFEICGEACDGEEGLEKILKCKPDIILADINMPVINGLTFSKKVKEKYPYIHIILITGYNEFEYARQALKIGVANYISKPFEKQELIESILSVKDDMVDKKKKDTYINKLQKQYNDSLPILKNNILYNAVKGAYNNKYNQLIIELNSLGVLLPEVPILISVIEADIPNEYGIKKREDLKNEIKLAINNIFHDKCLAFDGKKDRIIVITGISGESKYGLFIYHCNEIIRNINKELDTNITIGTGILCEDISAIPSSYEKACIALRNKFLIGDNKIIEYKSLKIEGTGTEVFPFKLKNDLLMYLRLLDNEKVDRTLCRIYNFLESKPLSIDYIYILYTEIISLCFSYISEYGYNMEEIFGDKFHPLEEIINKGTMKETHDYVASIYRTLISSLNNNKKNRSVKVVNKAKEYIDNNFYRSDLHIEEIAANTFFHPSYLRFIFKKEVGVTIGQYLTQVRMIKAKELVKDVGLKYTDIANMVGYSDAAYFSKCFKKYYNISPSEYEKLMNQ